MITEHRKDAPQILRNISAEPKPKDIYHRIPVHNPVKKINLIIADYLYCFDDIFLGNPPDSLFC